MTTAAANVDDRIDDERTDDPGNGKLFEVPRVAVIVDDTDPTVLKLAFSGSIELERGKSTTLTVEAHVAGAKTAHRRDSEGDVDAVVQTKSLIVHSLDT